MTPGLPDKAVIHRRLAALRRALENLRRHAGRTAADLHGNTDLRWTVEHGLQLCAQNALDIATHLVAAAGMDAPDYATAIDRLAELSVLPVEFTVRFRQVAGFRNVLVHGYLEVDMELVARILSEQLEDFAEFASHVERYLGAA